MRKTLRWCTVARISFLLSVSAPSMGHAQAVRPVPVPTDPVGSIIDAFVSHDLVAFPDAHGNLQNHALRLALIRDPRFAATVNDIVLELGNARHQDIADRYVRGDDVPLAMLRPIWEDTTVPTGGNNYPLTYEVLEAVRDVNRRLPRDRQLRVLLADPPIDWEAVRTREDHAKWIAWRDSYPAALIQLEVLAKGRKALLSYGQLHYQRRQVMSNYNMSSWQMQTVVSLLEGATPTRVFVIFQQDVASLGVDVTSWPVPSLALLRGTTLGSIDFARYAGPMARQRFSVRDRADTQFAAVPEEQFRVLPAEEQVDAVLYCRATFHPDDAPLARDPAESLS